MLTGRSQNVIQEEETFARLRSEGRCVIAENEGKPDGFVLWETGSVRPCLPLGKRLARLSSSRLRFSEANDLCKAKKRTRTCG